VEESEPVPVSAPNIASENVPTLEVSDPTEADRKRNRGGRGRGKPT